MHPVDHCVNIHVTGWHTGIRGIGSFRHLCTTLCLEKYTTQLYTNDNFNSSYPISVNFGTNIILLREYAIKRWFNLIPRLFSVHTLPCETLRP